MTRQSVIALPTSILEEETLKRVIRRLIEEIDKLLGNRGDNPALRATVFSDAQDLLAALTAELNSLQTEADNLRTEIEQSILILRAALTVTKADIDEIKGYWQSTLLDSTYYDFNATEWNLLRGNFEFTTTGDMLVNAPFTPIVPVFPTPQIDYTIHVTALPGIDSKAILRMIVIEDGVNTYNKTKAGGSWS